MSTMWSSGIEGQRRANLADGTYRNPVIGGDHPDPTILRVGDTYYMTFSSFDASPGIILWKSTNLVDWDIVGPILANPWGTVFACDLIAVGDRYYIYIPFMPAPWSDLDAPTIAVMWTDDIEGEWNGPIDLGIRGMIDPGHAIGEDGKRYLFLNGVERIALADDGLSTIGPQEHVYDGWRYPEDWIDEAYSLEGPKHVVRDDWHYLISAVGGTAGPATGHMVIVARSRSIDGPWENMPTNPLVRCQNDSEPWWSRGHGTLLEGPDGQWYLVYHAYERGHQELGRQVCLEPVDWSEDGWPVARGGDLRTPLPAPATTEHTPETRRALSDDFTAPAWGWRWTFDRPDADETTRAHFGDDGLTLAAKGTDIASSSPMLVLAGDHSYTIGTELERLDDTTRAGLLLYFNHRLFVGMELEPTGLTTWAGGTPTWGREPVPAGVKRIGLRIDKRGHIVTMYYRLPGQDWTRHSTRFEASGYHANTANDLVSLRPALFAAGSGSVRFTHFTYRGESDPTP
ncbi:family 43 glycosylhydrolase [Nanchangia anserum]|uniref:Family 43 glycosylhydrolase n=1 Tax=Nanchangia anserum TaxID=2692125 RepID=A0A8I0KQ94_9ACTO|nr:family 43 glycosylhydrolase [Nanchangia anserum]MBD3689735.1 family 43 glycosylhydrolase [Nanchangia anserum]QOX81907.1 family 43 glycosylhydrolase [Nanchangia anserum]